MSDTETEKDIRDARRVAGRRLLAARKARRLNQRELGSLVGVTGGAIAQIEGGFRGGGRDLWRKIAGVLGTSTDWLLDGIGRPPAPAMPVAVDSGAARAG